MNTIFICNQNKHRSKTAEALFPGSKSAGLYNEKPVTKEQLEWADTIVVMEEAQRAELVKRYPNICLKKKLLTLNIPDAYQYKQPELVSELTRKTEEILQ